MQRITKSKYILRFKKPASLVDGWGEALPIGNGNIGALVQGGARYEKIMLASSSCTWKGYVGVLPDVGDKLKEVRRLAEAKNATLAGMTFEKAFEQKKYFPQKACPLPIADLCVETELGSKYVSDYSRFIDMSEGEASVCFNDSGTKHERSIFVSMSNDLIFYEIAKSGPKPLCVTLSLEKHDLKTAVFNGEFSGEPREITQKVVNNFMYYAIEDVGVSAGVVARVIPDSKANYSVLGNKIKVENAERILVVLEVFDGKSKEKAFEQIKGKLNTLKNVNYLKQLDEHSAIFSRALGKTELSLAGGKEMFVENLIDRIETNDPLIFEKMFYLSKYLYASGVSAISPTWFVTGPWSYYYASDSALAGTSTELMAMQSLAGMIGKADKMLPLIEAFDQLKDDFKKNAGRIYRSAGYMVPQQLAVGTGLPASTKAQDLSTVLAGACVGNLMCDYFMYSQDLKFFKETSLPFIQEVINFYTKYFYEGEGGKLVSLPSFAPMGVPAGYESKNIGVMRSATADFTLVRALIKRVIDICLSYSIALPEIVDLQNFLNRFPPLALTESGAIAEYADFKNSPKSAGVLQLFDSFGTGEVSRAGNARKASAHLKSVLEKINDGIFSQNSYSLGVLALVSARLGQGDACYKILKYMISSFASKSLVMQQFDHKNMSAITLGDNYFNLASNELFAKALLSSLICESYGVISILPAKPTWLKEGSLTGLQLERGLVLDLSFDDEKGNMLIKIKASKQVTFGLALFKGVKRVKGYEINLENPTIDNLSLQSGKSLTFEIKY